MFRAIPLFLLLCIALSIHAQQTGIPKPDNTKDVEVTFDGKKYNAIVTPDGDTLMLMNLHDVNIFSTRSFNNDEEYKKYLRMRNYANKVYPYAKEAIRIFRELEYASKYMSKKDKKKKIAELEKELTREFEEPLTNLSKLQGKIMVKMIEKETKQPIYNLIKDLKGTFKAFYWNTFSKLYSYDLKEGYNVGQYPLLDAVLQDFDLSYQIENETNFKYVKINRSKK
ncbi:MAG TPA: DUF4294 domain-containing protein [Saprospiraceae bacterium]|nr:DUF4294 domain-containing protein [Saprospiraceae bacterium]HRO07677.1 DUF4294 domain-containing protein [Saprospiraceae bacterium]HRO72878.1 DUF4294 domain-containing protein [Saprospiraceae bacterium]HRP40959.1 DUF4294 domain-containing protein [Saprospiraceae bacterium]